MNAVANVAEFQLTARQTAANRLLTSDARHVMLFGGSRSGKTFLLVRAICIRAMRADNSRHAIMRYRFNAVKQSVWADTFPKVMRLCFPAVPVKLDKQDYVAKFPNGSEIWFGGLDDKERTEKILGMEFVTGLLNECSQISYAARETFRTRIAQKVGGLVPKMYYDENPPRVTHWTYRLFISKVDPDPPNRRLPDLENYASMLLNPRDNAENLPSEYLTELQRLNPRARLRFWEGQFGSAQEGALWTMETIERNRVSKVPPQMVRVVVSIDPSGTKGEDEDRSDYIGIIVAGVGTDGHGYVLEDITCKAAPAVWGRIAVTAYQRHEANAIVGETNFGGAMVEHVIKTAAAALDVVVPFIQVTASRGKMVRAEPVSGLYEQNKIHHVGVFPELEDQMCDMTTAGYMGDRSPDRLDALVWAASDLFPSLTRKLPEDAALAARPIPEPNPLDGW